MKQGPVRTFKKYPNRRIYDTELCRYVTLQELATFVREGNRIEVRDSKDSSDLTRHVLLQVILEEQGRIDILPIDLLHLVIRTQGTIQQAPLAQFLGQSLGQFQSMGDAWTRQIQSLFPLGWSGPRPPGATPSSPAPESTPEPGTAAPGRATEGQPQDLDTIRRRMEEMVGRLQKRS